MTFRTMSGNTNYCCSYAANATTTIFGLDWHAIANPTLASLGDQHFFYVLPSSGSIVHFTDPGGGLYTNVNDPSHGLTDNQFITIYHTTNYDGVYQVRYVDADNFIITHAFSGDETGNWYRGSGWQLGPGGTGVFRATLSFNLNTLGPGQVWQFAIFQDAAVWVPSIKEIWVDLPSGSSTDIIKLNTLLPIVAMNTIWVAQKSLITSTDTPQLANYTFNLYRI